jgi:hypothetical protein
VQLFAHQKSVILLAKHGKKGVKYLSGETESLREAHLSAPKAFDLAGRRVFPRL